MRLRNGRNLSLAQSHAIPMLLPAEIICIIAEFSSFETRLALVRCNKWWYKTCTPLLYEEVHLDTPSQLCMLYRSKKAMQMLENTKIIFMDHRVFCSSEWKGIKRGPRPTTCIIRVFQAAVSLRRLQFVQSHYDYEELPDLTKELSLNFSQDLSTLNLVSDLSFLPNLEILVDSPANCGLTALCNDRALALMTRLEHPCVIASFFPALDPSSNFFPQKSGPISPITRERIASSRYLNLSDSEATQLVRDIICPSRLGVNSLELTMVSADSVLRNRPSPVHNPHSSVLTIASTIGYPGLSYLYVRFIPELPHQSASAQNVTLKKLTEILPECEETRFSHPEITWSKYYHGSCYLPRPAHLAHMDWIAYPGEDYPEVLKWWLDILGLEASGSEEQLRQTATKLRRGMRGWCLETCGPSEQELYRRLLALVP